MLIGLAAAMSVSPEILAADGKLLQEFRLPEHFGVTHATQIVAFDLAQEVDSKNGACIGNAKEGQLNH